MAGSQTMSFADGHSNALRTRDAFGPIRVGRRANPKLPGRVQPPTVCHVICGHTACMGKSGAHGSEYERGPHQHGHHAQGFLLCPVPQLTVAIVAPTVGCAIHGHRTRVAPARGHRSERVPARDFDGNRAESSCPVTELTGTVEAPTVHGTAERDGARMKDSGVDRGEGDRS